jgi:hypothetical protein
MLPRVLNSFGMTVIFVAIVLFIVNSSALQPAGQAAFTHQLVHRRADAHEKIVNDVTLDELTVAT